MANLLRPGRTGPIAGLLIGLASLAALAGAAQARDRKPLPPVQISPELAGEWLLQLSPGSGVLPGYVRPHFELPPQPRIVEQPPVVVAPSVQHVRPRRSGYVVGRDVTYTSAARPTRSGSKVVPSRTLAPRFLPQDVPYDGDQKPGTIVIDTKAKFLYHVGQNGTARRYGVGVGKPGFGWHGTHPITRKAEWPGWTPPQQMIARERKKGRILPAHMEGGEANPLGARALYLGSTLYRIHGTNQPWTIGRSVSSGCIRMRNQDVMDLYDKVAIGTTVVVL